MSFKASSRPCAGVAVLILLAALALPTFAHQPAEALAAAGGTSFAWAGGNTIVEHRIPEPNAQPWSITTDTRGGVWFVEQGTNQVGEYDPASGNFTQHSIPTPMSTPDAIAADAAGNIWFAELTANKLGELQAGSSDIVEHSIPGLVVSVGASSQTVMCGPGAVLAGQGGVVWVACLFSNQIDAFDNSRGTFSTFDLPVFQSAPAGLALDGKGDLWFTAADANMLGKAVISQLKNGTSQGISEFAPLNQTYNFKFDHPTSFTGSTDVISSSIATPSGIAVAPDGRIWVTEHVDSSFDSFNPVTNSLVRYWESQTFGALGYSVTFPNGVAVAPSGTVWVGEHYGNRIAEFIPSSGVMTEYPVPCCKSSIAGVYSVALAPDGRLWFVEIGGDAIGEVRPTPAQSSLAMSAPASTFDLSDGHSVSVPLVFSQSSTQPTALSLSVSGVSATGVLQNMTAQFSNSTLTVPAAGEATTTLDLATHGLKPGAYEITVSATTDAGVIYSAVLGLRVAPAPVLAPWVLVTVAGTGVAVAIVLGLVFARRPHRGAGARRRSLRISLRRAAARTTTPRPAAA